MSELGAVTATFVVVQTCDYECGCETSCHSCVVQGTDPGMCCIKSLPLPPPAPVGVTQWEAGILDSDPVLYSGEICKTLIGFWLVPLFRHLLLPVGLSVFIHVEHSENHILQTPLDLFGKRTAPRTLKCVLIAQ